VVIWINYPYNWPYFSGRKFVWYPDVEKCLAFLAHPVYNLGLDAIISKEIHLF